MYSRSKKACLIIAEAGVNHNGDINIAHRLVDAAADSGVNLVKFQTFTAEGLVTRSAEKAVYQKATTDSAESQFAMLKRLELSREMHQELIAHCRERRVGFLSTAFDMGSIDLLVQLGVDRFKIPSGEITNLPYLRHIGKCRKPIILSTGMATLGEIESALSLLVKGGMPLENITVMHCNTEYPTPMTDVNLLAMLTIRDAFGVEVGYSDHTLGIEVPIAAVALGASIIEKHFTLDRALSGPDHRASLEPNELKAMVKAIRNIELALGDGIKQPSPSETKNIGIARKSIVASQPIRRGSFFTEANLTVKRPGTGISPMRWSELIGQIAQKDYEKDELI